MGGVAQGAGQALLEDVVYDHDSGQLLTGTLMDYGIPRADTMPSITIDFSPVPTTTNPLGVRDVPMPATPERVWRAIRQGSRS